VRDIQRPTEPALADVGHVGVFLLALLAGAENHQITTTARSQPDVVFHRSVYLLPTEQSKGSVRDKVKGMLLVNWEVGIRPTSGDAEHPRRTSPQPTAEHHGHRPWQRLMVPAASP
jgi:hypothetical protein